MVGGRDLVAGGGWLALRSDGRHAAVTNVRTGLPATAPKSRGWLVRDFVLSDAEPRAYLEAVRADVESYGAFNLVVGDRETTWACGTGDIEARRLGDGVHVISNGRIGVHWPKTERLQRRLMETLASNTAASDAALLDLLLDEERPADGALPDTGIGIDLERLLAPVFVRGTAQYGTRAATLAHIGDNGRAVLRERTFAAEQALVSEVCWTFADERTEWTRDRDV